MIDLGTGDGTFAYQSARRNPKKFYIGVDPNPRPLEKISEKIHRKPAKGGAPNVLFIQSAVEDLPSELDGVADEVHIHFPWGSLLGAAVTGDKAFLQNVHRICAAGALLEVIIGLDPDRDRSEIVRLDLPALTLDYFDNDLGRKYEEAGFSVLRRGLLPASEWAKLESSWAKKLAGRQERSVLYFVARVFKDAPADENIGPTHFN